MKALSSLLVYSLGTTAFLAFLVLTSYTDPKDQPEVAPQAPKLEHVQQVQMPKIPDSLSFAGEAVPIKDMDMRERFDREQLSICFRHSATIHSMKLANRYFPMMEEVLKKNGVPDDFKYLAVTESNLLNATSPAGAKGIWQFMPATARMYGLEVNKEVDERLNFYLVTEAACKLLKRLKNKFGSWTLAAAAYNCGEGRVQERQNAQGGKAYYDLELPAETMRYLPRIFATKCILANPESYGFFYEQNDLYPAFPAYRLVTVNGPTNWAAFCKEQGVSYRTLKLHNPWILSSKLTNTKRKSYTVRLPKE